MDPENEIVLLQAMARFRPIVRMSSAQLWSHISTLYNLDILNAVADEYDEDGPIESRKKRDIFPFSVKSEFYLPFEEFDHILQEQSTEVFLSENCISGESPTTYDDGFSNAEEDDFQDTRRKSRKTIDDTYHDDFPPYSRRTRSSNTTSSTPKKNVEVNRGRVRLQKDRAATGKDASWIDSERKKIQAYEYLCHIGEAKEWIEACIREHIAPIDRLEEDLRNGIALARLAKFFQPAVVRKIFEDRSKLQYRHSDNINYLFMAMRSVGLPE
ncbi:hypothetical protein HK096_002426, partial [Nowakowskiella sp. JEL0078]